MDTKQLIEYKKFAPPPVIWTLLILIVGWAIQQYCPPEYTNYATLGWGVLLTIAAGYGVSRQKLYELATDTGIELPTAPAAQAYSTGPAGEATQYDLPIVVKPAANQAKVTRFLI